MKKRSDLLLLIALLCVQLHWGQQYYTIKDADDKTAVSYATISFGNGNGIFADAQGRFIFSKKIYKDIDSLYISAIGYKDLKISTQNIPASLVIQKDIAQLQEVIVTTEKYRKYKVRKKGAILHDNYFTSWLPTVESEIAVFFAKEYNKPTKIAAVYLPLLLDEARKGGKKTQFSTLFKMQFYENLKGAPGKRLFYDDIIFRVTHDDKATFELNIEEHKVFMPPNGFFIAIQVLGYTDKKGGLQHTKKYHEVETRKGLVKISTTFRPLLPFTNKIAGHTTFTRRIFYKNKTWQRFDKNYSDTNGLINKGFMNYGMGLKLHVMEPL
ncbi:carboxypeptidase-like regulatory domain-containing protein [Aquimarina hainanensis]|uniref:Carboxypeptidase-like regulatory domain-containing protein n=1 Tax=Aquimarina hainanensis TaxID=1578017 RepID=A0ABW5NAX9_9FLAO